MANLTTVTYAAGTLASTTAGDVSTIDNLITSLTDKSQFTKLTDGTDTLLVDSHGSAQTTLLDSGGAAVTFNANGQAVAANSAPITMASDRQNSVVKPIAMSTDTSQYASGDLIADTQSLDAFFNKSDGAGVVNSITIIDQDAQGAALYILLHNTTTSMGSENSAPNISDANAAAGIAHIIAFGTGDYVTVSGTKVATIIGSWPVKAVSGTDDLAISVLNGTGTPTYTATGLNLTIGGTLD